MAKKKVFLFSLSLHMIHCIVLCCVRSSKVKYLNGRSGASSSDLLYKRRHVLTYNKVLELQKQARTKLNTFLSPKRNKKISLSFSTERGQKIKLTVLLISRQRQRTPLKRTTSGQPKSCCLKRSTLYLCYAIKKFMLGSVTFLVRQR